MKRYSKAFAAVIGTILTIVFNQWGAEIGLPADWPATMTAALTPLAVLMVPNA